MEITIVNHDDVQRMLNFEECIEVLKNAFSRARQQTCLIPPRTPMILGDQKVFSSMAAFVAGLDRAGVKVNTVFSTNSGSRYHIHQGAILVFETENGCLEGIVDAAAITNIRTAAASALATRLLTEDRPLSLAILGAGTQGHQHLRAMAAVRPLSGGTVWDILPERAEALAELGRRQTGGDFKPAATVAEAVSAVDLVCIATPASEPVLKGDWIKPGAHINSVGFSGPGGRELDDRLLKKSRLYVDWLETILHDCGDIIVPLKEGVLDRRDIIGDLGDMVSGAVPLRQSKEEITLFKATGVAIEDLACADYLCRKARREGRGARLEFGGFNE